MPYSCTRRAKSESASHSSSWIHDRHAFLVLYSISFESTDYHLLSILDHAQSTATAQIDTTVLVPFG